MKTIGIFIFNEMELLDFAGPFEVFTVASELNDYRLCKVYTISEDGRAIRTVNGLQIVPDFKFGEHPPLDIVVIPGGVGTKAEMMKSTVMEWVRKNYESSELTMSVCSGARILGKLGLLDGVEAVTHHEVIDHLREIAPKAIIQPEQRFVDSGKILTSAGISAGIDLSLYIVTKFFGEKVTKQVRAYMEYGAWQDELN